MNSSINKPQRLNGIITPHLSGFPNRLPQLKWFTVAKFFSTSSATPLPDSSEFIKQLKSIPSRELSERPLCYLRRDAIFDHLRWIIVVKRTPKRLFHCNHPVSSDKLQWSGKSYTGFKQHSVQGHCTQSWSSQEYALQPRQRSQV